MHHPTIKQLRQNVYNFTKNTVIPQAKGRVLEVGPDYPGGSPFPEMYIDIKSAVVEKGLDYFSMDNRESVPADFICDIVRAEPVVSANTMDTIIMLEVLEHVWRFWELPQVIHTLLRDDGVLFLSTPFYFMQHDPKPDYWRFTGQALEKLFSNFSSVDVKAYPGEGNFPLHYTMVAKK